MKRAKYRSGIKQQTWTDWFAKRGSISPITKYGELPPLSPAAPRFTPSYFPFKSLNNWEFFIQASSNTGLGAVFAPCHHKVAI